MRTQESNTTNNQTSITTDALDQNKNQNPLEKTAGNLSNVGDSVNEKPDTIGEKQGEINNRLKKLDDLNKSIIGRWTMTKGDKELLRVDADYTKGSLEIIRQGENNNISAIAAYQTRYLKAMLHNLVLVGESNMTGTAKLHFENAKMVLHEKLLEKMEEVTQILEDFEKRAASRPEKFKNMLLEVADRTLAQWGKDFDVHLEEFSDLLKKTFDQKR